MTIRLAFLTSVAAFFLTTAVQAQIPDNPVIDSVSIVDVHPVISWFPNETNTTGYSVYRGRYELGFLIFDSIKSLYDKDTSYFVDEDISGCTEQRLYKIRAFNDENASNWLVADTMTIILITEINFDLCANSVSLSWIKYKNMLNLLGGYWVLASEDGGPYSIVGTTGPSQSSFVHTNLTPNVTYTYKIRAFNEDETRTSTSCERSVTSRTYNKPGFAGVRTATIENNEFIRLNWDTDEAPISGFRIFRSETNSGYSFLDEITDLTNYNPATTFTDTSARFNERSYYYKIDVYDSCEKKHLTSENFARTIHLAGEIGAGSTIALLWNPYEGWENGIEKYELYREVDGVPDPAVELSGAETSYDDNIADLTGGEGNFSYYLKAFEKDGNNAMSQSNKVTIELESSIDIPNAFIPGGTPPDHEFKPIVDFIEQGFYQMLIFNKWGQQIFESNSVDTGWDGKYENDYVPAGTYVYMISFRNARGETVEKRGTVSVLR